MCQDVGGVCDGSLKNECDLRYTGGRRKFSNWRARLAKVWKLCRTGDLICLDRAYLEESPRYLSLEK